MLISQACFVNSFSIPYHLCTGMIAVAAGLSKNKTLTHLYLNSNCIGDIGATALGLALVTLT